MSGYKPGSEQDCGEPLQSQCTVLLDPASSLPFLPWNPGKRLLVAPVPRVPLLLSRLLPNHLYTRIPFLPKGTEILRRRSEELVAAGATRSRGKALRGTQVAIRTSHCVHL